MDLCDNYRVNYPPSPFDSERLVPWFLTPAVDSPVIGLLRPIVVEQLIKDNERSLLLGLRETWNIAVNQPKPRISFGDWFDNSEKRSDAMADLCKRWQDVFPEVCGTSKWRNELYPVYADPFGAHDECFPQPKNFVFKMERSACACFGVVTYGVHMIIFQELGDPVGTEYYFWIPTRAKTKPTWPGFLDNSVAGGIEYGSGVLQCLIKESMEEASIPEHIIKKHAKAVGVISYFFRTSQGWLQPEVEYVYDMNNSGASFEPRPLDGEVEVFELLPHEQVLSRLRSGKFKPNCALVLLDFFIRHGLITPDNEPDYLKITTRLHGQFDYERWAM